MFGQRLSSHISAIGLIGMLASCSAPPATPAAPLRTDESPSAAPVPTFNSPRTNTLVPQATRTPIIPTNPPRPTTQPTATADVSRRPTATIPADFTMDKMFAISLRGTIKALLTDAAGYRVGVDGTTGEEYSEMFGASYLPSENGYWLLTIPVPQSGTQYTLQLVATGDGAYDFFGLYGDMYGVAGLIGQKGSVKAGERLEFPIDVSLVSSDVPQLPEVIAGGPGEVRVGEPLTFAGHASDRNNEPLTLRWDFGDGNSSEGTLTPTHRYTATGTYTATLTATDPVGLVGTDSLVVTVRP